MKKFLLKLRQLRSKTNAPESVFFAKFQVPSLRLYQGKIAVQVFSCLICEIFNISLFTEHPLNASVALI